MRMTFEELKEAYPNPMEAMGVARKTADSYCVGGAFCKGQGIHDRFPNISDLARYLREYDTSLPVSTSRKYATDITTLNDDGNFDGAWDALEQAITYEAESEA